MRKSKYSDISLDKKPDGMTMKDFLIRKMVVEHALSIDVVRAVISHQFDGISEAFRNTDNFIIELSGFGRFTYSKGMAARYLKYLHLYKEKKEEILKEEDISVEKREYVEKTLLSNESIRERMEERISKYEKK